jgi:nucleoside phosphorylase
MGDRQTTTIGVVTALPIECAAMRAMIDSPVTTRVGKDPNPYEVGTIPSADSQRPHGVALCLLADDGTRNAAATTELLHSFPSIRVVVMCGIAGGVPAPGDYRRHVRLGDVVVATEGIVDYDHMTTPSTASGATP